ncbi:RMDN3 [Mytilus coruscus]|uniref:RMDN3 n=1 Tax=Mytilus coruscus TaxID=42192 RepID=A0A6J8CEB1_MYTCO|nr:RMDN3 [Mytilus coruscus]
MSTFFKQNSNLMTVLGTSLCVGVGGTILYLKLTSTFLREIHRLSSSIETLKAEITILNEKLEGKSKWRKKKSGYYSVISASSGDETDNYEDAVGGSSEFETPTEGDTSTDNEDKEKSEPSADVTALYTEIDTFIEGGETEKLKAYEILQNNKTKYLTDADFHWRLAKCTYQLAQIEGGKGNVEKKKEMLYTAKDTAERALHLNQKSANSHKWYSITLGSIGDYEGTQNKIKNGYVFKEHIEKAIELNRTDPSNHHLLGRWCYGVYMLSWLERKAAATLFATPPTSTAEDALTHFLEADRLNPGVWKENLLYIGKCYIELRKYSEAVEWLEKASLLPVVSQDDKTAESEIESLLARYGGK